MGLVFVDDALQAWWPDFATLVAELRRIGRSDVADLLVDAVRAGACGSEILGNIGIVLRSHRALWSQLDNPGARAWDLVMADVNRSDPLRRLVEWFYRVTTG